MANKKQLVERVDHIKQLIENKGGNFNYTLPKKFTKEDIFKVLNEAHEKYKTV